jgi:hypothetical protein
MVVMVILKNYYVNTRMIMCLFCINYYNGCYGNALEGFSTLMGLPWKETIL